MATISNPHLKILVTLDTDGADRADVTVTGKVNFTLTELHEINQLGNTSP